MAERRVIEPDLEFIREVRRAGGDTLKKCYQCATCSVVCNLSPSENPFPRKEMILSGWGQTDALVKDPDIWLCYQCNDCTTNCPREARPGDVLAAIRTWIYKHYAVPSFMGKALATPSALPVLFLIPILILGALMFTFAPTNPDGSFEFMSSDVIDFNLFLPHSSVDALFVLGNILIFILAATGFVRFWKALSAGHSDYKMGFIPAAIGVIGEILGHNRFRLCGTNHPRAIAHMILLFGFIGAAITTGCVFLFVFIPHYLHLLGWESLVPWFSLPIDLPHPVKFIGMFAGIGLVVGSMLLVFRRWTNKDDVGANGYADYLFLYIIFFTGLTGVGAWLIRVAGLPMLAYTTYFLHMVFVFFLLWYMPYSKFAHMIYRTLALIHARRIGRQPRCQVTSTQAA